MRFKYGIITFGIIILILMLAGCGEGQPNKEGNSTNSQSSASINDKNPSANSETSILRKPTSIQKVDTSVLISIQMTDAMTGWASTQDSILRTVDGGLNWTDVTPKDFANLQVGQQLTVYGPSVKMFCLDAQTAWFSFSQESSPEITVCRTNDGGRNWESSVIDTSPNPPFATTLSFPDLTHGWLLAGYDVSMGSETDDIFQTNDGGTSWKLTAKTDPNQEKSNGLPFSGSKTGLVFADQKNGWLTGFTHGDGIWLYNTTDEGLTWTPKNFAAPSGFHTEGGSVSTEHPHFFGPKVGLLPVEFRGQTPPVLVFYITQDGGMSWNATTPVQSTQESFRGFQWSIVDAQRGFVSDGYRLYYTSDGMHSFTSITPNIDLKSLQQLDFVSEQLGWAIIDGDLWKTSNGGHVWTEVSWTKVSKATASPTENGTMVANSNKHYTNSRYGFSIDYPSIFSIQDSPPENGDGIKVYTPDKSAAITVYGSNVSDWDVNYYYQQQLKAHTNIAYKNQESNWYVVSWIDGDTIGYTKGFVKGL